jgi:hypothetical protein
MDDSFFKQTPSQLKQIGEVFDIHPNLFTLTFKKLTEYASKAKISLPSNSKTVTIKKRIKIIFC